MYIHPPHIYNINPPIYKQKYLNFGLWPKRPPLAFFMAETSVAEMSWPKRPWPKCPWPKYPTFAIFCGCTARFVSDLVGNPQDRFSQNETHLAADKFQTVETPAIISSYFLSNYITKTCPCFKHQIFHSCKKKKRFSDENV